MGTSSPAPSLGVKLQSPALREWVQGLCLGLWGWEGSAPNVLWEGRPRSLPLTLAELQNDWKEVRRSVCPHRPQQPGTQQGTVPQSYSKCCEHRRLLGAGAPAMAGAPGRGHRSGPHGLWLPGQRSQRGF